jgi:vitamin B12 transporter
MPSVRFVGTRLKGQYDAGPAIMPSYYTIDFYAGYGINKMVNVFADVRNITDQKYIDVVGYNNRATNVVFGLTASF